MDSFCICYNLVDHNNFPGIPPLPETYIVPVNNDRLGYVEKQATPQTLASFKIPYLETPHEQLLEICSSLKIPVLEQQFRPAKKRKTFGFADILKDPKIKDVVINYINNKLSVFYALLIENQYAVVHNAQRKDPFEVHRLSIGDSILNPILEFTKTDEGIDYAFSLKDGEKVIIPQNHSIQILLNEPSWIVLDKSIYHIDNLNANKLKPFFSKEKITIAKKHIKTYLDKVIIPVIKNVDVIANGFEIIIHKNIASYGIEIIQDFIKENYVAKVVFNYGQATFDYNSAKKTSSDVLFGENEEIQITQIKRDPNAEKEIIALLESKGLTTNANLLLELETSDDPLAIFNWVQTHHKELEKEGFEITLPDLENRSVNLDPHQIEIKNKKKMTGSMSKE
ncbi:SNF2 helicase associated domain-containing protein [uncultured Aquimarina sp.]|uniref:SNF2 helicase associated domain-containing protein n=1 Tax=uncultured Aquimarina sp. TaxID=575652 RepID=UPI002630FAC1|nr:SNF2 helicase associated domain-containing protein [uncultured Aquimarina sp.]